MISGLRTLKDVKKPVKIHTFNQEEFQQTTLELLKPDFEFVESTDGYEIVKLHGSDCLPSDPCDLFEKECYTFLRETLLKDELKNPGRPTRLLYISRSKSHELSTNQGRRRRQVLNEYDAYNILKKYHFEFINLEDFSLIEKIRLFQDAKMIISPNGGALTMCLFAHNKTKVIEIHDALSNGENQHFNICKNLDIDIERYTNVTSLDKYNNVVKNPSVGCEYGLLLNDLNDFENFCKKVWNVNGVKTTDV
jgi:capsular polysaccharide biosynthesis protein